MEKFHCTYEQMMNEPYEIIQTNLMIMSLEAQEEERRQKMEKLKSKFK